MPKVRRARTKSDSTTSRRVLLPIRLVQQASEGVDGPWWLRVSAPFRVLVAVHAQATVEVIPGAAGDRAVVVAAVVMEVAGATAEEEVAEEAEVGATVEGAVAVVTVEVVPVEAGEAAVHLLALRVAGVTVEK